ncbi:MAG: T9SS type A sorting domain-containing protein [Cyclobacteriaceae bacterium]
MEKINMESCINEVRATGIRVTITALALFSIFSAISQPWHSGSSYRRAITINSADFDEDVANLIYYFSISGEDFSYADNCSFVKNENGFDFVFTDDGGMILNNDIIEYVAATGQYRGWVEIPNILASSDTEIYLYFGERGATDPVALDPYASDIVGAWHFDTWDRAADVSGNGRNLTIPVVVESSSGRLDECITFNSQDHVSISTDALNFSDTSFSVEGWINVQPKPGEFPLEFIQISAESVQHAEEPKNTSDGFSTNGLVIQLGRNVTDFNDFSRVGFRFNSLGIPSSQLVTDAYLEFVAHATNSGFASFDIYLDQSLDPEAFGSTGSDELPSERALSATPVQWVPTSWVEGQTYRTPNLASLIQPIVDNGLWTSGNIAILIDGFGVREVDADGEVVNLVVEYDNPNPDDATLLQETVVNGVDDVEQALNGTVGTGGPLTLRPKTNDWVGVRFADVNIPNNAVIDEVRVSFRSHSENLTGNDTKIRIYREDSYDSDPFVVQNNELSEERRKIETTVDWEPGGWVAGVNYETPDLSSLFTNFFSQAEWSANNAITLLFQMNPEDEEMFDDGGRTAVSRGVSAEAGPQLQISYYISENEPQTIISRHDEHGGFRGWVDEYGKLSFAIDNTDPTTWEESSNIVVKSLDDVDDLQWHHFAAVKELDRLSLYLDGEPQDTRTSTHRTDIRLIQDSADDAIEDETGFVEIGDNSLDFGSDNGDDRTIGLRFQNVDIPANATVISSFIQIVSRNPASDACEVTIYGYQGHLANAFEDTDAMNLETYHTVSNLIVAGAPEQDWSIDPFSNDDVEAHNSPDISHIIEYIIHTDPDPEIGGNWAPGSSMAFIISGTNTGQREVRARDSPTTGAGGTATLFIEYKTEDYGNISGMAATTMYLGDDSDHLGTEDQNLHGSIDHLRVYSSALSADKVRAQYRTITDVANFSTLALDPEQVTWTGTTNGDWGEPTNWNTGIPPWENMDFVYNPGTVLSLTAPTTVGHLNGAAGATLDLNDQQLAVDCSCEVETFSAGAGLSGTVSASGTDIPFTSPGISTTIPNLAVAANSSVVLSTDLVVTRSLSFGDPSSGHLNANGQNVTFSQPTVYAPSVSLSNLIILGSGGTLTIENVPTTATAIFPVSHDNTDTEGSFARVELTNNEGATLTGGYSVSICDVVFDDGTCDDVGGGTQIEVNDVNKTWDVTTSSGDSNLRLFWNSSTEGDEFINASAQVNHYNAVDMRWEFAGVGGAGSTEHITSTIYSAEALNVANFSPFSVSSHGAPLPVELVSFEAITDGNSINVMWETSVEFNNHHFLLEKSIDGHLFEDFEIVAGAGNTSILTEYKVIDDTPVIGYQYYRLTQVDFDGTSEGLGVRVVDFQNGETHTFDLFPNPVTTFTSISNLSPGYYESEMLTLDGRVINRSGIMIESQTQVAEFNLESLPTGVYMLNLKSGSAVYSKKLVKR